MVQSREEHVGDESERDCFARAEAQSHVSSTAFFMLARLTIARTDAFVAFPIRKEVNLEKLRERSAGDREVAFATLRIKYDGLSFPSVEN